MIFLIILAILSGSLLGKDARIVVFGKEIKIDWFFYASIAGILFLFLRLNKKYK